MGDANEEVAVLELSEDVRYVVVLRHVFRPLIKLLTVAKFVPAEPRHRPAGAPLPKCGAMWQNHVTKF